MLLKRNTKLKSNTKTYMIFTGTNYAQAEYEVGEIVYIHPGNPLELKNAEDEKIGNAITTHRYWQDGVEKVIQQTVNYFKHNNAPILVLGKKDFQKYYADEAYIEAEVKSISHRRTIVQLDNWDIRELLEEERDYYDSKIVEKTGLTTVAYKDGESRVYYSEKDAALLLKLDEQLKEKENEKEKDIMNLGNVMGDLQFGKANSRDFKLSMNGIAVRSQDGKYNVYDPKSSTLIDVAGLTFDFDALYVMPSNEVAVGDIILHAKQPFYVVKVEEGRIEAVKYADRTIAVIPATKNIFGFNFYTKVVSLFGAMGGAANEENPFGAMFSNPIMLMMLMGDKDNRGGSAFSGDFMEMMLMSQMFGGGTGFNLFGTAPKTTE